MTLFSEDRWQWFKDSLNSANELLEKSLIHETHLAASPHYDDPEDYAQAHYYRVEEPSSVLRAGLFCQLAGAFEYTLFLLTLEVSEKTRNPLEESQRDIVATRIRFLGNATGKNYQSRSEEITALTRLRNLLLHRAGDWAGIPDEKDPSVARWMKRHEELTSESGVAIVLTPKFFPYCLTFYDSWIGELLEDVRNLRNQTLNIDQSVGASPVETMASVDEAPETTLTVGRLVTRGGPSPQT